MEEFTPDPPQLSFAFDEAPPVRDFAAERRAKHAAYMREYLAKNSEKINADRRARRAADHEHKLAVERAYRDANREKVREWKKPWNNANPDKMREYKRAWDERNRDEINQKRREQYWADIEKTRAEGRRKRKERHAEHLAREAAYRDSRRDDFRAYFRDYYQRNLERSRMAGRNTQHIRRARLQGNRVEQFELQIVLIRDCGHCGICGKPVPAEDLSFDHIHPIARGGPHTMDNLQVAHIFCNKSKGAKLI